MRILFVTATRIGDAVLSSGVLAHLVESNPTARFTIACGPLAAPLFTAVPRLDRIVSMEKRKFGGHWFKLWAAAAPRLWSQVIDLRGSAISYLVLTRSRRVKRSIPGDLHVVEQYARTAGLETVPAPRLWTAPEHWGAAERLIPPGPPVLALSPAANWRGKEWPAHRFLELARRLVAPGGLLPGARIAVFGSAADRVRAEPVLSGLAAARCIDLVGVPDVLTAYLCLRRCALFVGNDSGTMHLAAAAGIPTLGLFGPSRDVHYRPWGERCAVVRTPESYDELIGQPGYDHRTTGTLMGTLGVEAVETAARMLLDRIRKAA